MSRFLSRAVQNLAPYTPGEQPQDKSYIKLNTNECPYGPSLLVREAVERFAADSLRLYPDPDSEALRRAAADYYGLKPEQVFAGGGSDEALAYAFMAFFDRGDTVLFPDITYGFYQVYADLFALNTKIVPLTEDFRVQIADYFGAEGHIFLANPNAPTGTVLPVADIEEILRQNSDKLVIVDEAYVDFAPGASCVGLIASYDNLLVVQTFSKSRALAGMRLGFAFGQKALIDGLERIKYSFNPYNLDRASVAVGIAALADKEYLGRITGQIIATRQRTAQALTKLSFTVLPSGSNFLFAASPAIGGQDLYLALKEAGILVRHFNKPRIADFVRITIGTDEEMRQFLQAVETILQK